MSYDLTIFFPHPEFPTQAWYEVLESFRSDACDVRFDDQSVAQNGGLKDCSIATDDFLILVGGYLMAGVSSECAPPGTHWRIGVSTGMGRSALALWIQHAIPYHALVFFPGVTVHDCQYHLGRSVEESSWTTPESWLQFAERRLWRMGPKRELVERGMFYADGRVRF
jgi:hypothetical protein